MRWQPTGLWRHPDFLKLWIGQAVSELGSGIGGTALGLTAVLALGATPAQMGLLALLGVAPTLLLGLLAGVWVDRRRRRPILIAADLGRALLVGSVPVAAWMGVLSMEQLYVVVALVGVLTVFFQVADQAFFPTIVAREHLVEGNSKRGISSALAEIGGPALGGILVQALTAPFAIILDALSFVVSALSMALIRTREPAPAPPATGQRVWRDIGAGVWVVLGHPLLRATTVAMSLRNFFGWFFGALYGWYLINELQVPPALFGIIIGTGGIGALLGALVADRVVRRWGLGRAIIGAMVFDAAVQSLVPLAGGPLVLITVMLVAAQVLGDVAYTLFSIGELSLRQAAIPDRYLGRANASVQVLVGGVGALGAPVAGLLGEALGLRATLGIALAGFLLAAAWLYLSPVRRLREPPAAPLGALVAEPEAA